MDDYRRYRQKPQQDPNAARNELFGGPQRQPNYPPPGQYPPPSQYGGAPQNPYGQNPYGGYGQNPYGGGGYPQQGGYSPYGQQRTEEEEVDEIKTQIRQTKLDSLQSTHNSLAAIQRAEQSAQITLNKLGEQSQRIDYTEKQLDLAAAQAEVAQAKASKLKKVNGSMFGFDIGLPFTKNREKSGMKKVVDLQSEQKANKEQRQQGNWESQQRVYDAMQTVSKNNSYQSGRSSDRSRFQFEADEEDEQIENRLDSNLDQISNGLSRLQAMAIASGQEVQRQTGTLDRISDKTGVVNNQIAHTTHTLKNIK